MKFFYTKALNFFLLCSFIFPLQIINAQILKSESLEFDEVLSENGSKPWIGNNAFLYKYLKKIGYDENKNKVFYRVPVKFWVYRNSKGKKGVSESYLRTRIRELNYYYSKNNVGIQFFMYPEITYIDSDRLHVLKFMSTSFFQALKRRNKGTINVLIAYNLIQKKLGGSIKEYHGVHNSISNTIVIRHKVASQSLAHEIGHYFGLKHPHNNWKRGKFKQEAVSRTRKHPGLFKSGAICEYNGDGLCDTPAEPNLSKFTDTKCNYTGNIRPDNWGDRYKPNTNNIMSYGKNRECRQHFTKGQIAVMLYTAGRSKYADYWKVSKHAETDFDENEPNNVRKSAAKIKINKIQNNTFHLVKKYNKNIALHDDTDWFRFEVYSSNSLPFKLKFGKNKYPFPPKILISFYKDSKFIKSEEVSSVKEIKLGLLTKGMYYIKVSDVTPQLYITGYDLTIVNK